MTSEEPLRKRKRLRKKQPAPEYFPDLTPARAAKCGLSVTSFSQLVAMGWPIVCFNILIMMTSLVGPVTRDAHCVEYFSGVGNVAGAYSEHGMKALTYDIIDSFSFQNLNSPEGFVTALHFGLRLLEKGLGHWATVCSTWVFMSRSCTGRTKERPYGLPPGTHGITRDVQEANVQVGSMVLVIMLLLARGCTFLLEQPMTSLMDQCPILKCIGRKLHRFTTSMGSFGAATRKPTWLLSDGEWAHVLSKKVPKGVIFERLLWV